jgi:hypothetical protein
LLLSCAASVLARSLLRLALAAACFVAVASSTETPARADDATAQARSHYEMGLKLFDAREHEQALIEFGMANDLKPRPAALFMMAQCEYLLGRLKDARAHYLRYATENPTGEFVELAKDRIQSIDKRPSTLVINTVPDDVTVRIRTDGAAEAVPPAAPPTDISGQAPNNFLVPRGRYRIDVTKQNYQGQTRIIDVDVAETKGLFFKLDPIPARLEIETSPPGATLYVNGNRARNPYRQDVAPGHFEIFAEAPDHENRTIELTLTPGQRRALVGAEALHLSYEQRSGRPELIVASSLIGGFVGAGAVAAAIGKDLDNPGVASVLLVGGGGLAGLIAGALVATPLVPRYVADNRALFIIGGMWIGAAEGAATGVIWQQLKTYNDAPGSRSPEDPCPPPGPCRPALGLQLRAGFVGSLPGLALGLTAGALLADRAPTYGRVALIQSAALGGALAGALGQLAIQWKPYGSAWEYSVVETSKMMDNCVLKPLTSPEDPTVFRCPKRDTSVMDLAPGALIGLNVGLALGVLGAYLPDQTKYGPSWKRVLLVDLAAGAGMLVGGIAGCVANTDGCLRGVPQDRARSISAGVGLAGGVLGLLSGILLTRHVDDAHQGDAAVPSVTLVPVAPPREGGLPGLAAIGSF